MVSTRSIRYSSVIVCLFVLFLANGAAGSATGYLTDVQIAKDQKRIVVRYEGEIGKHAAFVIERPHRLVIDFSSTALGNTPRKIRVEGHEIREIRLGQTPSRARLVLDFGSNPVPPFRIQRMDAAVLVTLDGSVTPPRSVQSRQGSVTGPRKALSAGKRNSVNEARKRQAPSLAVKRAGVEDELVYVELVDKNMRGKTYRLVVDCSLPDLAVRHASLSDEAGTLRRFDLAESAPKTKTAKANLTAGSGARRTAHTGRPRVKAKFPWGKPMVRAKFHWGKPAVRARKPRSARDKLRGPFKLEAYKLKIREQDT